MARPGGKGNVEIPAVGPLGNNFEVLANVNIGSTATFEV